MAMTDQQVQTPIGPGTIAAAWTRTDGHKRVLVSMPVTDANRPHLDDANCMSRGSDNFGLWIFDVAEVVNG